uniref:Rhomboid domain-containing protein n=1 Tax=Caenorhabditis tropicalis TaxID=1561998 RepID=A0A1I7SXR6_9PELO
MASASTPGSRGRQQENTPLSSEKPEKPPLTRDSSVFQQFSHFIGISGANREVNEEKAKWDNKRIRRLAQNYSLNKDAVQKFVREHSIAHAPSIELGTLPAGSVATPSSVDDVERGVGRVSARTPVGRVPIGPTPSLPNYESTSTSFEGRSRADSFSQTADISQSQTRLSKISHGQRESVPNAVINSVTNLFKKGSFINKNRMKLQSSFASKCSFDIDTITETLPETTTTPSSEVETSPVGIVFKTGGEAIEMKTFTGGIPKSVIKKGYIPEKETIPSEIPEETSFEVELEEMGDIDEAQGVEMDPTAISRMTARVRKKSSIRQPPLARFTDDTSHPLTESKSAPAPLLQRFKTSAPLERPCDLQEGTRPIIHPSSSLPTQVGSMRLKKKSRQEDDVLEMLVEESEQKDREDGREHPLKDVAGPSFRVKSRRPALHHPPVERSISLVDEVFFDTPPMGLRAIPPELQGPAGMLPPEVDAYHPDIAQSPPTSARLPSTSALSPYPFETAHITVIPDVVGYPQAANISYIDVGDSTINVPRQTALGGRQGPVASRRPDRVLMEEPSTSSRRHLFRQHTIEPFENPQLRQWHEKQAKKQAETSTFAKKIAETSRPKRQRGIGVFGKFFGRAYKNNLPDELQKLVSTGYDERPWFTYWMTTIQTVVCVLSLLLYGFGPFGINVTIQSDDVMDVTLSNRRVSYQEQTNIWFGPHYADLIRLGAVYSPCMRKELGLWKEIEEQRQKESQTGCCIANDHSGCYQSSRLICPRNVARWVRWDQPDLLAAKRNFLTHKSKSDTDLLKGLSLSSNTSSLKMWKQQRKSGAVCGQDPSYCDLPSSVAPYEWPDDITQWPICEKKHEGAGLPEHVTCEVTGRPCCIQLQGLCRIATKEYCDFVRGHWHENATLCSQVNCFSGVCAMIPFFGDNPNQFYRLFTSLFVHAGLFHLILTIAFQGYFMRDLEFLIGSKRMAILYFCSGIGGNLAAAIFVPYNPAVGPSSAQCGILAAVVVDCYHHRVLIEDLSVALRQHLLVLIVVLIIGLIPWVDNWAHLFGSIFGLLTAIVIFPYIDFDNLGFSPEPAPTINTVPNTPLLPRGSLNNIITTAETPTMTAQGGYSQLANGYPSPVVQDPGTTTVQTVQLLFRFVSNKFRNKRTFYVLISFIVLVILLLLLLIIFFGNVQFECPWCIYFNCLPFLFQCHNQGQKLTKWLPI